MAFRLAELFVEITGRDSPLGKVLGGIHAKMDAMSAIGLRGGQALAGGLWTAFNKSAELGETKSKIEQVFGGAAGGVIGYADTMADSFGMVKKELLDAAAQFGLIAQGLGMSQAGAAKFSTVMAQLAADVSSFYNVPMGEALEKIRAGLTGEAEPLKALGVIMNETMVKQKALALGFKEVGGTLSEQAKFAARAAIIQEGLAKASGDLARTYESDANQMRAASGRWENAIVEVGAAVEPAFAAIVSAGSRALGTVAQWFTQNQDTVMGWAKAVGDVFETIGFTFTHFSKIAEIWGLQLKEKFVNAGELGRWLMDTMGTLADWFSRNWVDVIRSGLDAVWAMFKNAFTNIKDLVMATWDFVTNPGGGFHFEMTPLLDGFKSSIKELPAIAAPELSNLQGEIQKVLDEIGADDVRLRDAAKARLAELVEKQKQDAAGMVAAVAGEMKAAEKQGPAKDKKAQSVGLEDYVKKLQEGAFGKDTAKEQLAVQKQQAAEAKQHTQALNKIAGAVVGGVAGVAIGPA